MDRVTSFSVERARLDASITPGYMNPIDAFNVFSPSAWLNTAIESMTGVNILVEICESLTGDWALYSRFGSALVHLADCVEAIGINVQGQVDTVDASWDGQAGDAAFNYFTNTADPVRCRATVEVL